MNRNNSLTVTDGGGAAPMALLRSGLVLADLVALALMAFAFLAVLATALAALAIAAGGINFVLGLHYLDYFPTFPALARILSGLSLLAFSGLLAASTLLLWRIFRAAWRRFWSWHATAWQGGFAKGPEISVALAGTRSMRFMKVSALLFAGLFAVSFILMMLMAQGPFWHAWRWFV